MKELIEIGKEQKEQQLKDLDTEARLLLIDRSIKSSLVRDHEDIATCVDRLAVLDRMVISLPVLAKCWTVVETIRKVSLPLDFRVYFTSGLLANECNGNLHSSFTFFSVVSIP